MKGQAQDFGLAVFTFVVVSGIMGFGISQALHLEDRVYMNTLSVPAERLGVAIYAMDAVERGETELKMPVEYGLEKRKKSVYLNYSIETAVGETKSEEVRIYHGASAIKEGPPVHFDVGKEGINSKFCINKTSQKLELSVGGC